MSEPVFQTAASEVHRVLGEWMLVDGFPIVYDTTRSHDVHIVDAATGAEYLDMFSFFASMPIGHNHPKLRTPEFVARLMAATLTKVSNSDIYTPAMADWVRALGRTMPAEFRYLFFIEGGALAVENALKVAFDWKVRKNIARGLCSGSDDDLVGTKVIHFRNAFHGRSGYTLSLTNGFSREKTQYFPKFRWPRVDAPGMRFPFDDAAKAATIAAENATLAAIRDAIAQHGHDIAALLIETIQGEGGDNHFRREFMQALRTLCDEHEILLVFDEIQCGMGLTGKWWAFEHHGVQPDVFSFGKKSQVCGIASTERVNEVDSCFKVPSRINSTWGGNIVDMVRATRYIEIIEQDDLLTNAREAGEHLQAKLRGLAERHGAMSNVRGRGLMCAFDLPSAEVRSAVVRAAMADEHMLILPCGPRSIRFRPVLDVTRDAIDEAAARLDRVIGKLG
ncbi:MAG: L-lysine 6-transaminase [Nannocystaceae bacterium]